MTFPRTEHPILPQTAITGRRGRCHDCSRGLGWYESRIGRMAMCRRGKDGAPHEHLCRRCWEWLEGWRQILYLPPENETEHTEAGKPTPGNPAGFGPHLLRYFAEIGARA